MPSGPSVFISYSSQDGQVARRLFKDLQGRGLRVWFDQREILAGDSVVDRIQEGLRHSDYLLVLISQHSLNSKWVQMELDQAFVRDPDATELRVIPILLDDSEMPTHLRSIHYVDLAKGYESGLTELLRRFQYDRAGKLRVDEIVNVPELAKDLGAEKTVSKGAEFFVATVIGVMTFVATVLSAVPAFQAALGNRPRVYYTVSRQQLSIPPGTDEREIRRLLQEKGFADSVLRLTLVNKGDAKATEVKVGTDVEGTIAHVNTNPPADSNPVWVRVSVAQTGQNAHVSRVSFGDLVPERTLELSVWYYSSGSDYSADVVADGQFATRVSDLSLVPNWSLFEAFKTPLLILAGGLLLAVLGGIATAVFRNPRLGRPLVDVIEAVSPLLGRVLRVLMP